MPAEGETLNLKHLLNMAWKARWIIVGIQIAATAAAVMSLKFIPKKYRSTTTIRIEKERVINPLTRGLAVTSEMEERLRTIKEEILSRDYVEKVINRLEMEEPGADPLKHEKLVQQMIKNIEISFNSREAETFGISYVGEEPTLVRDVTNLLSGIFIEDSLAFKEKEAGSAFDFLKDQLGIYRKKLEESEAALRLFEERHVDELPASKAAHLARLDFLRSSIDDTRSNIRQAKIRKDLLIQGSPAEAASVEQTGEGPAMVPNPLQARLREREARLRQLLREYSESYPDVVSLKAEIESLEKEIAENPTVPAGEVVSASPNTVQEALMLNQLQQLEVEIRTLTTREAQLEKEIERYEKKVLGIPQVEQELVRLERDYDVNNDLYEMFLRRVEEARVSRELEVAKKGEVFRILQAAALPLMPFKPQPLKILLMGIAAGLALNAALVYLLSMVDTSFRSSEEVQEFLGLKVMAGIPRVVTGRQKMVQKADIACLALLCTVYAFSLIAFLYWDKLMRIIRGG